MDIAAEMRKFAIEQAWLGLVECPMACHGFGRCSQCGDTGWSQNGLAAAGLLIEAGEVPKDTPIGDVLAMMRERQLSPSKPIKKPGREFPGVGVGAIVIKDESLLMVKRAGAHGAGKWSVPGGWVEMWEDPLQTAVREVREETGIEVHASEGAGWTSSSHTEDGVHAVTLWITCHYVSGEPTVIEPDKCPEVGWVPLDLVSQRPLFHPLDYWIRQGSAWRGYR